MVRRQRFCLPPATCGSPSLANNRGLPTSGQVRSSSNQVAGTVARIESSTTPREGFPTIIRDASAIGGGTTQNNFDSIHQILPQTAGTLAIGVVSQNDEHDSDEDDDGVLPRVGFDYNTSGDEEDDQQDALNRTRIRPIGNTFEDSRVVLGQAYSIMRSHYNGSWSCWNKVPSEEKDFWWREFEGHYVWKDKHSAQVKANWKFKCSQYLRSKFAEARPSRKRPTYKRPDFVSPEHWVDMKKDFQSDDFKRRSETNKRNRASEARDGTGIYTGGSKSVAQHVADYEKEHGKPMSQEMLIKRTYQKKDGTWSGSRPQIVLERNKELYDKFVQEHPEGVTQEDIDRLWVEAAGGQNKECVFGGGSLYSKTPNFRNPPIHGCTPSRSINMNNNALEDLKKKVEEELRRKIEEELRQKIEEEVQKSMEGRMQVLLMKQRDEDAIEIQRMLDMRLSRYVHPTPQIDSSFQSLLTSGTHMYASPSHPDGAFSLPSLGSNRDPQPAFPEQLHSSSTYFNTSRPSNVGVPRSALVDVANTGLAGSIVVHNKSVGGGMLGGESARG